MRMGPYVLIKLRMYMFSTAASAIVKKARVGEENGAERLSPICRVSYTLRRYQGNDYALTYANLDSVPPDFHQLLVDVQGTLGRQGTARHRGLEGRFQRLGADHVVRENESIGEYTALIIAAIKSSWNASESRDQLRGAWLNEALPHVPSHYHEAAKYVLN